MRPFLNDVAVADIKRLLLNTVDDIAVDPLSDKPSDLNTAKKALQEDTRNKGKFVYYSTKLFRTTLQQKGT